MHRKVTAALLSSTILGAACAVGSVTAVTGAVAASTITYDAAVMADGPRFYWSLDETTAPVRDKTGNAAASSVATARLGVAGVAGTAASFDGVSQHIQVPYTSTMRLGSSFTAEVWAKLPSSPQTTGWPNIFSRGNVAAGRYGSAMWVSSDSAHRVYFKRNGTDVGTSKGLSTAAYRHLAFTFDGTAKRWTWYVDGAKDTTGVLSALAGTDTETAPLAIGALLAAAGGTPVNHGKLSLDGLAIYGKALSATQVATHYTAGVDPDAAPTTPPTSPVPSPTATAPGVKRYVGGIAVGALQPWNTRRAADFAAFGAANATWIRSDLGWQYLEPVRGDWRWDTFDRVVADAKAAKLRYLAILHTVPGWANAEAGDYGLPADTSLLNNYCYLTAKRYIPQGVVDYQIGNEINLPHPGWQTPSGATYARSYLSPCVTGVRRAATELAARVNLVFGSLAPTDWTGGTEPTTFLTDAYAAGARGLFDAFAWHPYTGEYQPSASPNMTTLPGKLYTVMSNNGDAAKKIWATEYGVPTGGPYSVTEQAQSQYVNTALDAWYANPYAGPLFWYGGRDTGTSTTDREQHFGLLRYDGTAKPAYATLTGRFTR